MNVRVMTAALAATWLGLAACSSSSSDGGQKGRFTGGTAAAWETLATTSVRQPGFTDYSPAGKGYLFALAATNLQKFDASAWTPMTSPADDMGDWPGPAWIGDSLFVIQNNQVYEYSVPDDAWSVADAGPIVSTSWSQNTHDDQGNVYAIESDAPYRIVQYDTRTRAVTYFESGGLGGYVYEPRVAWDALARRLFIAPGYDTPLLFSFDPETAVVTQKKTVPNAAGNADGTGMGDPFCGDRSGHLYAAGDTGCSESSTVFQYDVATDTWRRLPDLPTSHGCDGACTVTDEGWLYFNDGEGGPLYRIHLD